MKRVVSVSLGSSLRDHKVNVDILGETFEVERIGTDGSIGRAVELIKELDGEVDAFGMGGIDLYLNGGNRKYVIKDAKPLADAARISPIADGTFVKNTLERKVINYIADKNILNFQDKRTLMMCAMDRFGMAESLANRGASMTYGDAIFSIGWDMPFHSMKVLHTVARIIAPAVCRMPFEMIYPVGSDQYEKDYKYVRYFYENEIIAGDFLYIKKYMPDDMTGKVIITNTVTQSDVDELKRQGAKMLITTTPEMEGRSFGTNLIEAILAAVSGRRPADMSEDDYGRLIDKIGFTPRVEYLNEASKCEAD